MRPEDREILEARYRAVFMEIQKRCPATPLVLLSPLAEGADRLAARVALACGAHLIVPLPMPQVVYEQDFQTPASLAEFRELLQRADRHFELPWADLVARETSGLNGEGRDRGRPALLGAYIAHNCQILLALWDGEDSGKEGGTAQVIRFKREGIPEDYARFVSGNCAVPGRRLAGSWSRFVRPRLPRDDTKGRKWNRTPRQLCHIPYSSPGRCQRLEGGPSIVQPDSQTHRHIQPRLDRPVRQACHEARGREDHSAPRGSSAAFSSSSSRIDSGTLRRCRCTGESYKPRVINSLKLLFLLVFLAALTSIYSPQVDELRHPPAMLLDLPAMLLAYLILLGVAYAWVWRVTRQGDFQNKFQDYLALAEGLRVQFYWHLVGLGDCVEDHYLSLQRGDLDWIRIALRNWGLLDGRSEAQNDVVTSPGPYDSMPFALEHWIKSQRRFFNEAIPAIGS